MASVTLDVPDDLADKLAAAGSDLGSVLRLSAAFSLCSRGELTTSQAARLAGLTYAGFLEAAARAKVDLFHYTGEEIQQELARPLPQGVDLEVIRQELARARPSGG
jgi:predicted HTH domain antitoxin